MSEETTPSVDEIKERLKVEIPVEEEETAHKADTGSDVAEEMRNVGRQFAETVQTAWNSEERQKLEQEVREGIAAFVSEVDKVFRDLRESPAAQKAKEEVVEVRTRVESGELGRKSRQGVAQGLRWLSEELGKLAEQFTPAAREKGPEAMSEAMPEAETSESTDA